MQELERRKLELERKKEELERRQIEEEERRQFEEKEEQRRAAEERSREPCIRQKLMSICEIPISPAARCREPDQQRCEEVEAPMEQEEDEQEQSGLLATACQAKQGRNGGGASRTAGHY